MEVLEKSPVDSFKCLEKIKIRKHSKNHETGFSSNKYSIHANCY